ncbi:hypothetical protein PFICI_02841 [Pestalotiopsis fici W106-1]|uniref:Macro domain-containing protein n=1 Tax=Pestalotiopsis fici (strain W106-1 / CGMCC3.15140) TaxID=1229662 RepID=W3XHW6_PESFW|nr:uncharacterized protein PFICI_02841 [Pestalotiopsis fici W106-1]ETS84816.1 hypothetical protein PFICI_02841 [Pestalotiopsis fici W106-1]
MEVESALLDTVQYLLGEGKATPCHHTHGHPRPFIENWPVSAQLQMLKQLLCERAAEPELPSAISNNVRTIYEYLHAHRFLTSIETLKPSRTITGSNQKKIHLFCWRGDITTLSGVTAITNAANSQMLGCFQPSHRCIDNVIHFWAGPGLRKECYDATSQGTIELPVGHALTTKGHHLPVPYIIHTVGPQLRGGAKPTAEQRRQLEDCYVSILREAELLPATNTRKAVAICCISTGLFAFPPLEATNIAVQVTSRWLQEHDTTITDVVFNTFTEADTIIYQELLGSAHSAPLITYAPVDQSFSSLGRARDWLLSADAILISAGAGLSAADGLDYTSPALFSKYFPAFKKYGLTTLYSVFGFSEWPSEQHRWGYYFTHLNMVKSWPRSSMYTGLISWLRNRSAEVHVRTSNADGLFLANGWSEDALSTPQGSYAVLQCLKNCRPDATAPSAPFLEAAIPFLDPVTQQLTAPDKIPQCQFCRGKMNICVRAGNWFNERPFAAGERRWRQFKADTRGRGKRLVILELGVGQSTPGVLQWPNEDMVDKDGGKTLLVRVGLGVDATVPLELEAQGLATYIDGDIQALLSSLCSGIPR